MLDDMAEPGAVGILGVGDRLLAPGGKDVALGRVIVAHDAFYQRALAGAVLSQQRMKRAGTNFQLDIVECCEIAEPHGHGDSVDAKRTTRHGRLADNHDKAPISAVEVATAPNTPPCILIILSACS